MSTTIATYKLLDIQFYYLDIDYPIILIDIDI